MGNISNPPSSLAAAAFANPSASAGLAPVNGVATKAMRSDAAPAIDQGIAPTWTGHHQWQEAGRNLLNLQAAGISIGNTTDVPVVTVTGSLRTTQQQLVRTLTPTDGWVQMNSGNGAASGYLSLYSFTSGTRQGYIGFSGTNAAVDAGTIPYIAGLHQFTGNLRLSSYGAGTLTTDASGNVTAVSDERIKDNVRPFTGALNLLQRIAPILYGYAPGSGLDQTRKDYIGFSAQQIEAVLPSAVGRMRTVKSATPKPEAVVREDEKARLSREREELKAQQEQRPVNEGNIETPFFAPDDYDITYEPDPLRTVNERALIALLVNAVKELSAQVQQLNSRGP